MPKYLPNIKFSDCWSSVGDITLYHRNGICYYRKKSSCAFPGTSDQLLQMDIHRRALNAWKILDRNIQEVWNLVAVDAEPHRPPFRSGSHISGFNLFVSAYHGFARLGNERIPEPRVWEGFPSFYLEEFRSVSSGQGSGKILIDVSLHLPGASDIGRYRLLGQVQVTDPGRGSHPGLMRTFLSEDIMQLSRTSKICRFEVPAVRNGRIQLHSKMLLIDSLSGYRSQSRKYSIIV